MDTLSLLGSVLALGLAVVYGVYAVVGLLFSSAGGVLGLTEVVLVAKSLLFGALSFALSLALALFGRGRLALTVSKVCGVVFVAVFIAVLATAVVSGEEHLYEYVRVYSLSLAGGTLVLLATGRMAA